MKYRRAARDEVWTQPSWFVQSHVVRAAQDEPFCSADHAQRFSARPSVRPPSDATAWRELVLRCQDVTRSPLMPWFREVCDFCSSSQYWRGSGCPANFFPQQGGPLTLCRTAERRSPWRALSETRQRCSDSTPNIFLLLKHLPTFGGIVYQPLRQVAVAVEYRAVPGGRGH